MPPGCEIFRGDNSDGAMTGSPIRESESVRPRTHSAAEPEPKMDDTGRSQ